NSIIGTGVISVKPVGPGDRVVSLINSTTSPTVGNFDFKEAFTDPNLLTFGLGRGQTVPVTPAVITRALAAGIDVTIEATNDLVIDSPLVVPTSGAAGQLTLKAGRSILVNANIDTGGGGLTLIGNAALADGVIDGLRDPGDAVITAASGVTID